jgi:hypothetical protein
VEDKMFMTTRLACASIVVGVSATVLAQVPVAPPATAAMPPDQPVGSARATAAPELGGSGVDFGIGREGRDMVDDSVPRILNGFEISWLPDRLGPHVSDFTYEWEDVTHRSRVWERGPDDSGGYSVDLTVKTLRGSSLDNLEALRDYLADYHERGDDWPLERFDHHGHPGYHAEGQAFWLQAPGVAVSVTIDTARFTDRDLTKTALGIRPAID